MGEPAVSAAVGSTDPFSDTSGAVDAAVREWYILVSGGAGCSHVLYTALAVWALVEGFSTEDEAEPVALVTNATDDCPTNTLRRYWFGSGVLLLLCQVVPCVYLCMLCCSEDLQKRVARTAQATAEARVKSESTRRKEPAVLERSSWATFWAMAVVVLIVGFTLAYAVVYGSILMWNEDSVCRRSGVAFLIASYLFILSGLWGAPVLLLAVTTGVPRQCYCGGEDRSGPAEPAAGPQQTLQDYEAPAITRRESGVHLTEQAGTLQELTLEP
eukprot:TRINITY_DN40821_c0_g1_i1.p1 TRINITY_DN40821_c0_g1~~TRINITY_DN40821_c0_g1_i1.p1  ORF type:complete len:271 (+),score=39.39 TRINITY_DN40821_c0_g1_i1:56-868(+)